MFEKLTPREKLPITSVNYAWSSIDQMYYKQVFKDDFFYEMVEQCICQQREFYDAIKNFSKHKWLKSITNTEIPKVLSFYQYKPSVEKADEKNVTEWITLLASLCKHVAYDALYVFTKSSMNDVYTVENPSEGYLKVYDRVRPMIEINSRKAIAFFIEKHRELGDSSIDESTYTLDKSDDGLVLLKLFVRMILKELIFCVMQKDLLFGSDKEEIEIPESEITSIIDVEMLLQKRYDEDSENEDSEVVFANVKQVMFFLGVPNLNKIDDFAKKMINLSFGAKQVNFGMSRSDIKSRTGDLTGKPKFGKRIHKSSNRNKMLMGSQAGERLLQKKATDGMLTERERKSSKYSTGGDVFLLVDCTGSTCPRYDHYGVINLEEVICSAIADACRVNNRKLTIYFYNESTTKTLTFLPTEPKKNYNARKLEIFGNGAYKGNDEVATFNEVFHEVSRQPGKKHSIIFMSDGGVLYGSDGVRLANMRKVKATLMQYAKSIEVLPLLISRHLDDGFEMIFKGYEMLHIKNIDEFDFSKLEQCIQFVSKDK